MKVCIDTCAYSRLGLEPPELIRCLEEADRIFVPAIVLGELHAGFTLRKREDENLKSLARFLDLPAVEVVSVEASIAERYGIRVKQLRLQGTPIPTPDIWIAAVTLETGAHLITYDSHFCHIPGIVCKAP